MQRVPTTLGGAVVGRARATIFAAALLPALVLAACAEGATTISGIHDVVQELAITVVADGEPRPPSTTGPLELQVGDSVSLGVMALNALGLAVGDVSATWSSSDPAVASVDGQGVLRAEAPGSAQVEASVDDLVATLSVVVSEPEAPSPAGGPAGLP